MGYRPPRFLFRRFELLRGLRPGKRFLEIGAANLALTVELLERFESGVALDRCDDLHDAHARLPESQQSRLEARDEDFFDSEFESRFDAVICCEVLEHVEDDAGFLRKIASVLEPDGQLVLSVPSRQKYWTIHDELVGHLRRYEKADLRRLFIDAGFRDVRICSYGWPWVNILRIPRMMLAKKQEHTRAGLSQVEKTTESNHRQIPEKLKASRLLRLCNRFTIAPLAWLSRAVQGLDLSDGYLVFATLAQSRQLSAPAALRAPLETRDQLAPLGVADVDSPVEREIVAEESVRVAAVDPDAARCDR